MGYRSDVAIALYKKDYDKLINRVKMNKNQDLHNLINNASLFESKGGNVKILTWDWTKWYNEFEEIQWIENFINNCNSAFVRIGEDFEDIEEQGFGEFGYDLMEYAYCSRNLEIDGKPTSKENI